MFIDRLSESSEPTSSASYVHRSSRKSIDENAIETPEELGI
jgi:hypothetical protein